MRGEFVDVDGSRLYYYAAGSRGAGEPVVFIHGFPGSSYLWHDVVRQIAAGHRLVVLDMLGFGRSDRPPAGQPASLTVAAHSQRLGRLLDELRIDEACLVGHALGGAVAQAVAVATPSRVTRLCLVNSSGLGEWPRNAARFARALCVMPPVARAAGAPFLAGLIHGSLLRGFADRERGRHALDQFLHAFTARQGTEVLIAQLRALRDEGSGPSVASLGVLRCPTAILAGANDPFLPATLPGRLRDAIAGATLEVIPDARHFVPEDAADRVAAAVNSLLDR